MNISKEFIAQAMRTNSDKTGTFNVNPDVVHATMGLVSETFELLFATTAENAFEEFSDMLWFGALFSSATGIKLNVTGGVEIDIVESSAKALDTLKAMYAYGGKRGLTNEDLIYTLAINFEDAISGALNIMCRGSERSDEETLALAQNVVLNKLRARYPDKFDVDHAKNRDTAHELEIITNSLNS